MFKAVRKFFKTIFEGNECRFRSECAHYREISTCCNQYNVRFSLIEGNIYCGTYRKLKGESNCP